MMQNAGAVNSCQYFFVAFLPCIAALFRACFDFRVRERAAAEGRRIGRFSALHGVDLAAVGGASSSWPRSMEPGASGLLVIRRSVAVSPICPSGRRGQGRHRKPHAERRAEGPSTERVRMAAKRTLARRSRTAGQLVGRERPNGEGQAGEGAKGRQAPIGARRAATAARRRE